MAGTADAVTAWSNEGIECVVSVPGGAACGACGARDDGLAAQYVRPAGDGLEMGGVHAQTIPAKVVDLQARGNRALRFCIGEAVSKDLWVRLARGVTKHPVAV